MFVGARVCKSWRGRNPGPSGIVIATVTEIGQWSSRLLYRIRWDNGSETIEDAANLDLAIPKGPSASGVGLLGPSFPPSHSGNAVLRTIAEYEGWGKRRP